MRRLTTEEFIERAKLKHGNGYDYSKTNYINSKLKVIIFHKKCGREFEMRPNDHLMGSGCPFCGGTKKMTEDEFISKANIVHNNFFSYSRGVYTNVNSLMEIVCPFHGKFTQKANNHLSGHNCPECYRTGYEHPITHLPKINASTKKLTNEDFIKLCVEKIGNKYDLSKVKYVNNKTHVTIICPIHGEFKITPNHLLLNRGCPKCANKNVDTIEFITKAEQIHGVEYDYSKVVYDSTHNSVIIIHKKCGQEFKQSPANHLQGQGCPFCGQSKMEKEIASLLTKENIIHGQWKRFNWLGRQSLDFYLPDFNIGIECQGVQHFDFYDFFGGEEKFDHIKMLDKLKKQLCDENGVKLLYYSNLNIEYPYEVITNKNELLKKITCKHQIN